MTEMNKPLDQYDAIVIGSGITGGWAAKELCEKGFKTLVLERGRMVKHIEDYTTANLEPWDFENRGKANKEDQEKQVKQARTGYTTSDASKHWFVNDLKHPYQETKRFDWIRGYHLGGRSITWYRMSLRMSDLDFEANKIDNNGVDWPIRYKDIESWYDKIEDFIGVSGQEEGLPQLPDGKFLPPFELNCAEEDFKNGIRNSYDDRIVTASRKANLIGDKKFEGRSNCQNRNRCIRGCPFGGYFSSLSSTLPAAEKTGNLHLRTNSIVSQIIHDEASGRATGVKVIDTETKEVFEFNAKVIFCCASTVATTSLLLQSKSKRFPNGLGNDSGELGHNLMDHHFKVGASGIVENHEEEYYKGRKPTGFYVPRFRNVNSETKQDDFVRGYGFQGSASREDWTRAIGEMSYGKTLKTELTEPGKWKLGLNAFGECLPYHENKLSLNYDKLDEWGLPTVDFDCEFKENEKKMRKDMQIQAIEMLQKAGLKNVKGFDDQCFPGNGIHEMGTARMGKDPKTSVLNANNQIHSVPNVYVTDGSCMTSSACQNPSLTYMALTARAAQHAANNLKNK